MIKVARAKLHGIKVTESDLDYHGSITLDPEHCKMAGILPLEYLDIWNKASGARIQTYAIYGEPGSRCCVLNGAAARTCQTGDEVIICASDYIERKQLTEYQPTVLTFSSDNEVDQVLKYDVGIDERGDYTFTILDQTADHKEFIEAENLSDYRIKDLEKMKHALREANWSGKQIADFVSKYTAA